MQAVILAAGLGTRMWPLEQPKALLPLANRPLLEHQLEALRAAGVTEAIVVVGHKGDEIRKKIGSSHNGVKITYAKQPKQLGTGSALSQASKHAKGRFLCINGDDLYSAAGLKALAAADTENAILVSKVENPGNFGVVHSKMGLVTDIIEKPSRPSDNIVNTGAYVFSPAIWPVLKKTRKSKRGEIELTDAVRLLAKQSRIRAVDEPDYWIPMPFPWSLLKANEAAVSRMTHSVKGTVEKGAVLKGAVGIGEGSVVRAGAYIEGPVVIGKNCVIGPNCFIRAFSSIGDNCHIGNAVELKNSIVMDDTNIPHLNYVGDSVIGRGCNISAATVTANLRFDKQNVRTPVKGAMTDTGLRKLGVICGDNVFTGINVSIMPGVKIASGARVKPGAVITKDVMK
jgi:bifunctional UDP-N-acetylglucosamine pyrophosphorylase/glucosamine-1-phosphate N-acetyltransferase